MMEAFRLDDIHKVVVRLHDKESWALWDKVWIMNAASRSDQSQNLNVLGVVAMSAR